MIQALGLNLGGALVEGVHIVLSAQSLSAREGLLQRFDGIPNQSKIQTFSLGVL